MNKKRGEKLLKQYEECRANLEWLVYWCLRENDPPISIGRGKELLGFTDMMQMREWLADYSYNAGDGIDDAELLARPVDHDAIDSLIDAVEEGIKDGTINIQEREGVK